MSSGTVRLIIGLVLIFHGIGHTMGILPVFGIKFSNTHSAHSWLLTRSLGVTLANVLAFAVCLLALLAFVGAGLALNNWLVPHNLWKTLTMIASIISLVGLVIFWDSFPFFIPNKVGVIAVDIVFIISILWQRWPSAISL